MLALPVERLVGNSTACNKSNSSANPSNAKSHNIINSSRGQGLGNHQHHHNHRNSASPDSSIMSDCSSCRSMSSSPASSPVKVNNSTSALIAPGSSPRSSSPKETKSQSNDLSNNDINKSNINNNMKSISPSPSPQPSPSAAPGESRAKSPSEEGALPTANSRKRRRSSSSCGSGSRRSRSNSPGGGGGGGHDLSRKGMIMMTTTIKREETSPLNSPPSCQSCFCQKSPQREDEELPSTLGRRLGIHKSNNNEVCNNSTTKIESGEEDGDTSLNECANASRSNNKINGNDRTSAHPYYHNHQPHDQESYSGDHHRNHHHFPHFNHNNNRHQQQPEEMRNGHPGSRSKANNSNRGHQNGDDHNESGGHPSLTVDNGLSSPGSISSTSSSNGRPPSRPSSRPPSTASTASSSCFSSILSLSTSTTTGRSPFHHYNNSLHYPLHNGHGHHHHHSHFLKFSIEDILRPDFGKVKSNNNNNGSGIANNGIKSTVNKTASNSNNSPRLQQNGSGDTLPNKKPQQSHSSSQDIARPNSRASSFKYHSDDSNCSSTSRHTEVVDETKVNPKVPEGPLLWPAWVYCTRYSDRPSSGPRSRRIRKEKTDSDEVEEKRPRTAFTAEQLSRLKQEFDENRYLTEKRRQDLAQDLKLHENQIKIWFQNKRAKLKKSNGQRNGLAMQLMAQGLYNHSTIPVDEDDEMMMM